MLEIIIIIISSICLVGVITVLVLFLTKKEEKTTNLDLKELGALSKQLEFVSQEIKSNVELTISKEIIKMNEINSKNSEMSNEKLERFQKNINESLNVRFDALRGQIDTKLLEINKKVDDKLSEGFKGTTESMIQVRERLKAIDEAQKNIESLSKDVVSLKTVLEGNQTRGQYGELQLDMVLHNVFGDTIGTYEQQYTIKKSKDGNDVRADAVVFMPEPNKMICIDSKFPFKDYQKIFDTNDEAEKNSLKKEFAAACKKHITAIKDKYIVEGKTAPEAIMFIPNDGVFAFVHHNLEDVVEYARNQKVILTSPSTLPPILWTINMVRLEVVRAKHVHEISKQLSVLGKQFKKFSEEWVALSTNLERVSKSREKLDSRVGHINTKFESISGDTQLEDLDIKEISSTDEN